MRRLAVWRDVDTDRPRIGFTLWRWGGEAYIGRRLYRFRLDPKR